MAGYHDGRNTFYIGEFDGDMEANLIIPLTLAVKNQAAIKDGHLDLFVNSYGGNAAIAFHIVELIELAKRNDVVVRTMVTSAAYSAGSIIAVAGTPGERYIARDAQHLAHYGSSPSGADETPVQAQRKHDATQTFFKQVASHYKKYCNIPELEENLLEDDWYISSREAIKWKMADKYLDKYKMLW